MRRVIGYDKEGHKVWSENTPTLPVEPADLDGLLKFDLSPSWKQQSNIRWEKQRKAKAA